MPDKIYSRKRIKIFKIEGSKVAKNDIKQKRLKRVLIVCITAIITAFIIIHQLNPVFNAICSERAKALATEIINLEASTVFKDISYEDLVNIVKDDERKY